MESAWARFESSRLRFSWKASVRWAPSSTLMIPRQTARLRSSSAPLKARSEVVCGAACSCEVSRSRCWRSFSAYRPVTRTERARPREPRLHARLAEAAAGLERRPAQRGVAPDLGPRGGEVQAAGVQVLDLDEVDLRPVAEDELDHAVQVARRRRAGAPRRSRRASRPPPPPASATRGGRPATGSPPPRAAAPRPRPRRGRGPARRPTSGRRSRPVKRSDRPTTAPRLAETTALPSSAAASSEPEDDARGGVQVAVHDRLAALDERAGRLQAAQQRRPAPRPAPRPRAGRRRSRCPAATCSASSPRAAWGAACARRPPAPRRAARQAMSSSASVCRLCRRAEAPGLGPTSGEASLPKPAPGEGGNGVNLGFPVIQPSLPSGAGSGGSSRRRTRAGAPW